MKKLLPIAFSVIFFLTFSSFFKNTTTNKKSCDEKKVICKPCCEEIVSTKCPDISAYNAPARVDVTCGLDTFITINFLYMQAIQKGIDLGSHFIKIADGANTTDKVDPIKYDSDFKPAFKLGIGTSYLKDDWKLFFEYFRYYSDNTQTKTIDNALEDQNYIGNNWVLTDSQYSEAKLNWKLKMNLFDFMLSRPFYSGKAVVFNSSFGLRGGFINQKVKFNGNDINGDNNPPAAKSATNQSTSWLIGPKIELNTKWYLCKNLYTFSNFDFSLLYQNIEGKIKRFRASNYFITSETSKNFLVPDFQLNIGLGYGFYFLKDRLHLNFIASYDFEAILFQNMIRHLNDNVLGDDDIDYGTLFLHGLDLGIKFVF